MDKVSVGSFTRPFPGEHYNGDAIYVHEGDSYLLVSVIDALGHGPAAHRISMRVLDKLKQYLDNDPVRVINEVNREMLGSDGAVIGIGIVREDGFEYSSLGNITCSVFGSQDTNMVTSDGILGSRLRSFRKTRIRLHPGDMIIMHSDGVKKLRNFRHLRNSHLFSSEIFARMIVEELGSDFDDATALVLKVEDEI